jgi:hypothetical protein
MLFVLSRVWVCIAVWVSFNLLLRARARALLDRQASELDAGSWPWGTFVLS